MTTHLDSRARADRIHYLDVARAMLMVLGIPFHASLVYTSAPWVVKAAEQSAALEYLPMLLGTFRMPGFFLIAGFFAALLLERRPPSVWMRSRAIRLGVPLLTGMALIVPLQNLMLRAGPAGTIHLPRDSNGMILSHLWFLPILLMLCALLALGWKWFRQLRFPDLPLWALGLLFGAYALALQVFESASGCQLRFFDGMADIDTLLFDAPWFFLGAAMRLDRAVFLRLTRWHGPAALIGLAALLVVCLNWNGESRMQIATLLMADGIAAVCLFQTILALLSRLADRPFPVVDKLVDASFSIYLFHHPIIIALALALMPVPIVPEIKWLAICGVTLALSYALHRAIRRSALFLFLFNGVPASKRPGVLVAPDVATS